MQVPQMLFHHASEVVLWLVITGQIVAIGRMVWVPLSDNGRSAECWPKVRDISIIIDERDDGVSSALEPL